MKTFACSMAATPRSSFRIVSVDASEMRSRNGAKSTRTNTPELARVKLRVMSMHARIIFIHIDENALQLMERQPVRGKFVCVAEGNAVVREKLFDERLVLKNAGE